MAKGGRREGAGRKAKQAIPLATKPTAALILAEIDEIQFWRKLLNDKQAKIRLETGRYLTNRRDGLPAQSVDMKHSGAIVLRHSVPRPERAENAS